MKKTFTLLFVFLIAFSSFAQDKYSKICNPVRENGSNYIGNYFVKLTDPVINSILAYPGEIPGTSNFWDYQTNGSCLNGIVVFGDTIVVSYPAVDSADALGAATRRAYYLISYNGGLTWTAPIQLQSLPNRSGYPDAHRIVVSGVGTTMLISGRKYSGSNSRGGVWVDAFFGLGSFTSSFVPEAGRDYFGDVISGGLYGGAFSAPVDASNDSLYFCKYNYTTNTMLPKVVLAVAPNGILGNVRYRTASNGSNNLFTMWYDNTAAAYSMRYKTSSDGGATWSSMASLQTAFGLNGVINGDTCSPWFGIDVAFKPNTTTWGAVWSTLYPTPTGQSSGDPQGCKILFASPSINGGVPVEVAGRTNMEIISNPALFQSMTTLQVGVTPVSHPTIAYSADGSRIAVAFSAYQPGDSTDGYNFDDIWMTYSDNGGLNWATPVKITDTHTWDELYPQLSKTGNTTTQFNLKYQATLGPGCQSFNQNAPVYRVYHVLRKFNPANVGINEIIGNVPTDFSLSQNYPNPFNPVTTIRFDVPKTAFITLKVFDITGKEVAQLVNENMKAGTKEVTFDATGISSGIYFYTLYAGDFRQTKKMMLIK